MKDPGLGVPKAHWEGTLGGGGGVPMCHQEGIQPNRKFGGGGQVGDPKP